MLGLTITFPQTNLSQSPICPSQSKPLHSLIAQKSPYVPAISNILRKSQSSKLRQFRICAQSDNEKTDGQSSNSGGSIGEGKGKNGRSILNLGWVNLLLDPDPDNILAVGLTGLLTWASVQVLWQLLVISAAILMAALKYSIVAALLIFILITLL